LEDIWKDSAAIDSVAC